jgi:hypothetical protein
VLHGLAMVVEEEEEDEGLERGHSGGMDDG